MERGTLYEDGIILTRRVELNACEDTLMPEHSDLIQTLDRDPPFEIYGEAVTACMEGLRRALAIPGLAEKFRARYQAVLNDFERYTKKP